MLAPIGVKKLPLLAAPLKPSSEQALRTLLESQQAAWNKGDLEGFMAGYWKSDETTFLGPSGVFRGWQAVLERYRRSYPSRGAMGQLTFYDLEIHALSANSAFVLGKYRLERGRDRPEGFFTLVAQKFSGGWRIVHDHTTPAAPAVEKD